MRTARGFFFPILPHAFVEELAFAQSVLFFDSGKADGFFDGNLPADGLCVDKRLLAHGLGWLLEHFEPEMRNSGFAQLGEELEGGLRLAHEKRVAAFRVALQEMTFALVVQDLDLVLGAYLAAFREPPPCGEGAREGAVFGMECGHVLVQRDFKTACVYILQQVEKLGAVQVPRGV